jgi:hypothetical protein
MVSIIKQQIKINEIFNLLFRQNRNLNLKDQLNTNQMMKTAIIMIIIN